MRLRGAVQHVYTAVAQMQPRKHVPDDTDDTTPTRQHEVDHADQDLDLPRLADLGHEL